MSVYWHKYYICPYFSSDDKQKIYCEGHCRLCFPDKDTTNEYLRSYCASDQGWKNCSIAKSLNEYYDTKCKADSGIGAAALQR